MEPEHAPIWEMFRSIDADKQQRILQVPFFPLAHPLFASPSLRLAPTVRSVCIWRENAIMWRA